MNMLALRNLFSPASVPIEPTRNQLTTMVCSLVLCLMFLISTTLSAPFNRTSTGDSSSPSNIEEYEKDVELRRVKLEKSIEDNKGLNEIFKYFISYVSAHYSKSNQLDDLNCKSARQEVQIKFVFHQLKGKIFPNKKPPYTTNIQPPLGLRKYSEILPGNSKQSNDSFNTKLDLNKTIRSSIVKGNGSSLKMEKENSDVYKAEITTYLPGNYSTTDVITVTGVKNMVSAIDDISSVIKTDFQNFQSTTNNTGKYFSRNENFMTTIKSMALVTSETGYYQEYNFNSTLDSHSSPNITENSSHFWPKEISKSPQMIITSTPLNNKIETRSSKKNINTIKGTNHKHNDKISTEEARTNEKNTIQDKYISYSTQSPRLKNHASLTANVLKYNNTVHSEFINFSRHDSSSTSSMFTESSELIKSQLPSLITTERSLEDPVTELDYKRTQNNIESSTVLSHSSPFTMRRGFLNVSHKDKSVTFPISYSYADNLSVTTPFTALSFGPTFSSNNISKPEVGKILNSYNSTLHKYFSNKTASISDIIINLVGTTSSHPLVTGHLNSEATDLNDIKDSKYKSDGTTMVDEFNLIIDQKETNKVTTAYKIFSSDNTHNPNSLLEFPNPSKMSLLGANCTTSSYQTGTDSVSSKIVEASSIKDSSAASDEMKITTNILPNIIYGKLKQSHGYKTTTLDVNFNLTQDQPEKFESYVLHNTVSLDNLTHETNNSFYNKTPVIVNFKTNSIPYVYTTPLTDQLGMNSMTSGVVEIDDMVNISHSSTNKYSTHNENESHTTLDYRLSDTITNLKQQNHSQKHNSVGLSDRSSSPYSSTKYVSYSMTNKNSPLSNPLTQSPTTLSVYEKAFKTSRDDITLSTTDINNSFFQSSVFHDLKPNLSIANSSHSDLVMTTNIDKTIPPTPKSIDSTNEPFTVLEGVTFLIDSNHSTYMPKIEFSSTLFNSSETQFDTYHDSESNSTIEATKQISVLASKSTSDGNYKISQPVGPLMGINNIEHKETHTPLTDSEGITADQGIKANYSSFKQSKSSTVSTNVIDDSTKKSSFLNKFESSSEPYVINKKTLSFIEDRTKQTKYMADSFRLSTLKDFSQHSFTPSVNGNNYDYFKTSNDGMTGSTVSKHFFSFEKAISGENSNMPYKSTYTTFTLEPTNIQEVTESESGYGASITSEKNINTKLAKNENTDGIHMAATTKSEYTVLDNNTSLYHYNTKGTDLVENSFSENFDTGYTTSSELYTIEKVSTNSLARVSTSSIPDWNVNKHTTPKYNYRVNETNIKYFKPTSNNLIPFSKVIVSSTEITSEGSTANNQIENVTDNVHNVKMTGFVDRLIGSSNSSHQTIKQQANFFSPSYYTSKITGNNDEVTTKTYSNIITEMNYLPTTLTLLTSNGNNNSSITQWKMQNFYVKDNISTFDQYNRNTTANYSIENKTENAHNVETNTQVYDIIYSTPYINSSKMFEVDLNIDSTMINGVEIVNKGNDTYTKVTESRTLTTDKIAQYILNTITTSNKLNKGSNILLTSASAFHESDTTETWSVTSKNKGTTKSIYSKYLTESKLEDDESSTEHYETTSPDLNNFTFFLPTTDFHTSYLPLRIHPIIVFNEIK